jgi:branched-chain amino acid transport system ATP-binding protein
MVPANQLGESLINTWLKRRQIFEEEKNLQEKAEEVIDFLNISHLKNERAANLSGGQKKLLELARTMMVDPKVVLLDEVGAGVNRTLLKEIGSAILKLNQDKGYTFCMIEHDMDFISRLCNPVVVLVEGQILTTGTPDEIKSNDSVIDAYLGKGIKTKVNA